MKFVDYLKSNKVRVGDFVKFTDGSTMLIGDATMYIQPTTSDGSIGWDWSSKPCTLEIEMVINLVDACLKS